VRWFDTPGAIATVTATFSNCGNEGVSKKLEELILSVKNQGWGLYTNSVNITYCTPQQVVIIMPHMYIQGTGIISEPYVPQQEVIYEWTLPAGWTSSSGQFTLVPTIIITPTSCAVSGVVKLKGIINDASLCPLGASSSIATVVLNATLPIVSVGVPAGFAGTTACNNDPVTFAATLSAATGCSSNNYKWTFPSGWNWRNPADNQLIPSPVTTATNTISLTPGGSPNDAGNMSAEVTLACGSKISSSPLAVSYIPPTVFGPDPLCTIGQFSVQNASGLSVSWASSNTNVLTINSSGLGSRVANSAGSVTISATLPCPSNVQPKTIWVGWPDPSNNSAVYEYFHLGDNPINLNMSAVYQFAMQSVQGASSYNWQIPVRVGWSFWIYGASGNPNFIQTGNVAGTYQLICKPGNVCGLAGARVLYVNLVSGGGGGGTPLLVASPNPANDKLTVKLSDTEDVEADVSLVNKSLEIVFQTIVKGKEVIIATQSIPDGTYFLRVVTGEKSTGYQVVIKH